MDPANLSATHTIGCVNFYTPETGRTNSYWSDDGEWGAGKHVSDHLVRNNVKNVAVFVCRHYGGQNLGKDRFHIIREAIDDALKEYQAR